MQKSNMKMNVLDFRSIGQRQYTHMPENPTSNSFQFLFRLKKSWKMIFNFCYSLLLFFSFKIILADQKFEAIIASVDSEAITTYDLSEE